VRSGDTRGHFAKLAPTYAELRGGTGLVSPLTDALAREADLRGRRVLDVGCGAGRLLSELMDRYEIDAIGVDRSPEMIGEARQLLGDAAELHVGPAESLPLGDQSVERTVMTLVAHLLDRPAAFREVHRVLVPQGVFAVASTDPDALETFWMATLFPSYAEIDRGRFPSAERLRLELGAARFGNVRVVPLAMPRSFDRETAVAKLRGRAYSTFAFLSDKEFREGVERAERELPETVAYTLRLLIAVASA
jgi:ubiquinone/menaquinone biosynthesis C-methylase UbiE